MSDYGIIIEHDEHPDFRARIVHDDSPSVPEFEEGVPTYRVVRNRDYVGVYNSRLEPVYGRRSDVIEYAWNRLAEHRSNASNLAEVLDRYLRIFHDGAAAWRWEGGEDYLIAVTAEELAAWGAGGPADVVVREASRDGEYFAYLAGEVYGIVIERKVIEHTEIRDMTGQVRFASEREAWEQVESVWGFYGDPTDDGAGSYIRSEARDMIALADH